ncbi:PhzF family phenazine biosynthesis protein [Gammaproteobacteria bacterium]|nr:PhzF family phenazine biosynthesis protein [Gammaproteobacteria bacterium]MDC3380355.1 PhzF family phenazine biosynthesis protein [Gammaproteobacteria bacterium]
MEFKMYQVDAFASKLFSGNPAAVVILESPLSQDLMQSIALENNLSETAFININESPIPIRWFTPTLEVNLCGHATMAGAKILFEHFPDIAGSEISFSSKSGILKVTKNAEDICLNFPADDPELQEMDALFAEALGEVPIGILRGTDDFLAVFETEHQIQTMSPDFTKLAKINSRGVVISAPGNDVDFVSRCFFPQTGVDEDPVTGSAHTMLIPYWAKQLDKIEFKAHQLSARGGVLDCKLINDRVLISGKSVIYFEGMISII